jgi:hypothetical protein
MKKGKIEMTIDGRNERLGKWVEDKDLTFIRNLR